ncbi:MAG: COG1470 family protein, partial [Terriglobales bacterium]
MINKTLLATLLLPALASLLTGCGGGASLPPAVVNLAVQLAASSLLASQDGTAVSLPLTINHPAGVGNVTLTATGAPGGVTVTVQSPGSGTTGSVTFAVAQPSAAAAGDYPVKITASDGSVSGSATVTLTVAIAAVVTPAVTGTWKAALSTSFQPASWDYQFFQKNPGATTPLTALAPQHIRLQGLEKAVPEQQAGVWDFSVLDAIVQPVLASADHSPEFQIAVAPPYLNDSAGHLLPANFAAFADYCVQLVKYYNTGGFDAQGKHFQSPSPNPIVWWGIFNEPNINGLSASQYVQLYNQAVPAMLAADPRIHFAAVELADFGTEASKYIPTFIAGVTAPVDVLATHFYSSCNQHDSDQALLGQVPFFASDTAYIKQQLATVPALAKVPVWITENNVNADFGNNGISVCNGGAFTVDKRGTSAFFAGWRPYVLVETARAGSEALYHWEFAADQQYGELNGDTAQLYL